MHNVLDTLDMSHPSVAAALVKRKQSGSFPVDEIQQMLTDAGVPVALIPKGPTPTLALRRAMQDACRGNAAADVKVVGRNSMAKYTITITDRDRLDLDTNDGKGVADATVTGSIDYDPSGNGYTVKLVPSDHPSRDYILSRMQHHSEHFSAVYDLGTWFGQQLMPLAGAVPTGSGDYYLPKGAGLDLVNKVREAFVARNTSANFLKVWLLPQIGSVADVVDAITDSVLEEVSRVTTCLETELDAGKSGNRRLATMTADIMRLREVVATFTTSLGNAFSDVEPRIVEIEALIGLAETSNGIS